MTRLEKVEGEVHGLDRKELAEFKGRSRDFNAEIWDRQIEMDAVAGRLESLAEKAMIEHKEGKTREV